MQRPGRWLLPPRPWLRPSARRHAYKTWMAAANFVTYHWGVVRSVIVFSRAPHFPALFFKKNWNWIEKIPNFMIDIYWPWSWLSNRGSASLFIVRLCCEHSERTWTGSEPEVEGFFSCFWYGQVQHRRHHWRVDAVERTECCGVAIDPSIRNQRDQRDRRDHGGVRWIG